MKAETKKAIKRVFDLLYKMPKNEIELLLKKHEGGDIAKIMEREMDRMENYTKGGEPDARDI